jgi:PAS domain S-box-containing protein
VKRPLNVLLVEDSPDDAALTLAQLRREGFDPKSETVETGPDFLEQIGKGGWDVVLADYQLPSFTGLKALELLKASGLDIPFILISGTVGEDVAVEAMKAGANDYFLKNNLLRLGPAVDRELREAENRRRQRAAELGLRESEQRLSAIIQTAMDAIITVDGGLRVVVFNAAAERMFRRPATAAIGQPIQAFIPRLFAGVPDKNAIPMERGTVFAGLRQDGEEFPVEASVSRIEIAGQPLFTVILRDITDRVHAEEDRSRLETQLRQAQKMEAIGTLAGGIAHDFNNILGAIIGNAELARIDVEDNHPARESIEAIAKASERAKELVRQILTFSRRGQPQRTLIHPGVEVIEATRLLRVTVPAGVEMETVADPATPAIQADATHLHQIIINLVTNALHALPQRGGRIDILVGPAVITPVQATPNLPAGEYCRLTTRDNGHGMDAITRERIFDPFFTTKGPGAGTGLGLSVVHGIVKSYAGFIEVESSPGQGTLFHVYLPAAVASPPETARPQEELPTGSGEEILVLDDELLLLDAVRRVLERHGYRPVAVSRPDLAVRALRDPQRRIRLALLDYALPEASGLDVAESLLKLNPGLPIILVSGNPGVIPESEARRLGVREILSKPINASDLMRMLARVLNAGKSSNDGNHSVDRRR